MILAAGAKAVVLAALREVGGVESEEAPLGVASLSGFAGTLRNNGDVAFLSRNFSEEICSIRRPGDEEVLDLNAI